MPTLAPQLRHVGGVASLVRVALSVNSESVIQSGHLSTVSHVETDESVLRLFRCGRVTVQPRRLCFARDLGFDDVRLVEQLRKLGTGRDSLGGLR
jgi:hypothetical protein